MNRSIFILLFIILFKINCNEVQKTYSLYLPLKDIKVVYFYKKEFYIDVVCFEQRNYVGILSLPVKLFLRANNWLAKIISYGNSMFICDQEFFKALSYHLGIKK